MSEHLSQSLFCQEKASRIIPGMTQLLSKRPDMFSRGVWPGYYRQARGVSIEDLDGNCYLDFSLGGIGATVLGYADPEVNAAVCAAISAGSACTLNAPEEVELAELLLELHPWAEQARFTRSGGEAMAVAVRLARATRKRSKVVFCGYHGWMDWYLAANLNAENALAEHLLPGLSPLGVPRELAGTALPFRFNDLDDFRRAISNAGADLAAIVLEPTRNFLPSQAFQDEVQATAKRLSVPLIMDEISAGFRICTGGAHLALGWRPDVAVFAKAIGNGFPMAAIIGKSWVLDAAQESFISSTNWTERTGPVAALATIRKFHRLSVAEHLQALGQRVKDGWLGLADELGLAIKVSGMTPMLHLQFATEHNLKRAYYTQEMARRGFLACASFYAMYAHTFAQVEDYLSATKEVWQDIATGRMVLQGQPAVSGFSRIN